LIVADDSPKSTKPPSLLGNFLSLSPVARVLILNQFFVIAAFSMVVPFLAVYMSKDLGLAPALVGLIIGLRTLTSQGMFLVGGSLADRMGARPTIIIGCCLRVLGFGLFAASTATPAIIVATLLTGFSAALFQPACRSYLAAETPGRRAEAFGLFSVAANSGTLIGPVIGGLLLTVDFRVVAAVSCGAFALLAVYQTIMLPKRLIEKPASTLIQDLTQVVRNRRFLVFAIAGALYMISAMQLMFAMVLEANRVTGRDDSVTLLFLASAVCGMAIQSRVSHWCRQRLTSGAAMALGVSLAGLCWLPIIVTSPFLATHHSPMPLAQAALWMSPVMLSAMILSAGNAMGQPYTMELMPAVGSEHRIGTYFGYYSLIAGVASAGGSALVGALMRPEVPALRWAPFAALMAVALAGAAIILAMQKRGLLEPREAEA
jgi:MFS family permease